MIRILMMIFVVLLFSCGDRHGKDKVKTTPRVSLSKKPKADNALFPQALIKKVAEFGNNLEIYANNNKKAVDIMIKNMGEIPEECDYIDDAKLTIKLIPTFSGNKALAQGILLGFETPGLSKNSKMHHLCYISISKEKNKYVISAKKETGLFRLDLSTTKVSFKKFRKDGFIIKFITKKKLMNYTEKESAHEDENSDEWSEESYVIFAWYKNGIIKILKKFTEEESKESHGKSFKTTFTFNWFEISGEKYLKATKITRDTKSTYGGGSESDYDKLTTEIKIYRFDIKKIKLIPLSPKDFVSLRKLDKGKNIPQQKDMLIPKLSDS